MFMVLLGKLSCLRHWKLKSNLP